MASRRTDYGSIGGEEDVLLPEHLPPLRRRAGSQSSTVFGRVFSAKEKQFPSRTDAVTDDKRESKFASVHSFLYTLLNPRSDKWQAAMFKSSISAIILFDLGLYVGSTDETFYEMFQDVISKAEGIVSFIFLVEYIARLVTVVESKRYASLGPLWGRLRYAITPGAIIDLLAILPFFLELATGWDLPTLTYLRFFRLFRILKSEGYVRAIDAVYRVIYYNKEILYVALLVCCLLVLVTALLLYYLRPKHPNGEDDFSSIPATLYLSTLMLTGQGGPEGDLPWYTKCVVLLTSVFSVAMFAIPSSMLTWGFEAEAERCAKLSWRRSKSRDGSSNDHYDDDNSSASSGYSTDEEYLKIIAGEEGEEEESDWLKAQKLTFDKADIDKSGTISLNEFIQLQTQQLYQNQNTKSVNSHATCEHTQRLEELEKKVMANGEKLDSILQLLKSRAS